MARTSEEIMEPGGWLFDPIVCAAVSGVGGSYLAQLLGGGYMPPLLGILMVGIIWGSLPGNLTGGITGYVAAAVEDMCVCLVVLRSGLNISLPALRKISIHTALLCFIPSTVEAIAFGFLAGPLLGFDWTWGLLLGFTVSATGKCIIVPIIIPLTRQGYGNKRGVCSLILASSALSVVYSITAHGIMMSMAFHEGGLTEKLISIPVQLIVGGITGVILGFITVRLMDILFSESPDNANVNDPNMINFKCSMLVLVMAMVSSLGFSRLHYGGAGALSTLNFGATVVHLLAKKSETCKFAKARRNYIDLNLTTIWNNICCPCLYGLVGAEVQLWELFDTYLLPRALGLLLAGQAIRVIVAAMCTHRAGLTWKDLIFVMVSWVPKSTVQVALSGRAFAKAVEVDLEPGVVSETDKAFQLMQIVRGSQIMSVTIVGVLIFATSGGIAMEILGRTILEKDDPEGGPPEAIQMTAVVAPGSPTLAEMMGVKKESPRAVSPRTGGGGPVEQVHDDPPPPLARRPPPPAIEELAASTNDVTLVNNDTMPYNAKTTVVAMYGEDDGGRSEC